MKKPKIIKNLKLLEEVIAKLLMYVALFVVVAFALSIVVTIISRGWPAMSWEMVSRVPGSSFLLGGDGGILNAIVGSLYIVGASTLLGLIISIPIVFYINVYLKKTSMFGYIARLSYDVLFGIPPIVYGAFGFMIMVYFGLRASLLGGIIVITLLIIPVFIRSMDEVARNFPRDILNAAYSLGATKLQTMRIVLRQIFPGIATATLLAIGRAIGDAAAVMLTAGYTAAIPQSLSQPAATLPLAVFYQAMSPIEEVRQGAYAAAFVLTLIVLALSIGGRLIMRYFSKDKIH
ncbi:MAG: ABC transporter permease subunit [Bacteroidales bacterium]|nr:ABC transporter permease subunit [Bacteroidales bacterium]